MVQEYMEGKRVKHFRPFAYVMIMTAISTLLVQLMEWSKTQIIQGTTPTYLPKDTGNFFEHYFSVFVFIMIPFSSLITWITFLKRPYNFWEHFLANTYIAAQLNIIWVLMHFVTLLAALFTGGDYPIADMLFFTCFISAFLYMYGSVFGFLMKDYFKIWQLILLLTLMNFLLYLVYSLGFQFTGLWNIY